MQPSLNLNQLRPGLQFNKYQLLEQIGVGGQAVVWSAEDPQVGLVVAIKFSEVPEDGQERIDDTLLEQELGKLNLLRHPHILPIHDYGLTGQVRYLVSPYMAGGSLFEKIKMGSMQLKDTLRYIAEIASALDFLHQNQIIHRDLKPSNVLMDLSGRTYLSDFGLARTVSNTTQALHTGRGTPPYAPAEQHKQLVITAKSDIFSFGIMLYELFTGQLPWNGERMLGMQQLYAKAELPDPCEINPQLPPLLKDVLRRMTSADPSLRPSSAGEVMKMIDYVFNLNGSSSLSISNNGPDSSQDASILLDQKMSEWDSKKKQVLLDPTRFAIVHLDQQRKKDPAMQGPLAQFLLYHSIAYGYHENDWWSKTSDPRDRASVSMSLLAGGNEVIAVRVLDFIFKDYTVLSLVNTKVSPLFPMLFDLAFKTKNPMLASRLLSGLRSITPPDTAWNDSMLSMEQGALLGKAALMQTEAGEQALRLIAHLHSLVALEYILKNANRDRLPFILLEIQNLAGSLPSIVSGTVRTQVFFEWLNQQITAQPARLAAGYATALLGSTLGIASQIYLTYRLPDFMDLARISSSLIQGLLTGFVFSFGIFLSRLVTERFKTASFLLRFGLGSIAGAFAMSAAFYLFHLLFLNTMPSGFLIPLGCFVIACSFSAGRLIPWRLVKMIVSIAAVIVAIVGTWWIHSNFSASITSLTPLFLYDRGWAITQIGFTAFCVAIWMGILGHVPALDIREE